MGSPPGSKTINTPNTAHPPFLLPTRGHEFYDKGAAVYIEKGIITQYRAKIRIVIDCINAQPNIDTSGRVEYLTAKCLPGIIVSTSCHVAITQFYSPIGVFFKDMFLHHVKANAATTSATERPYSRAIILIMPSSLNLCLRHYCNYLLTPVISVPSVYWISDVSCERYIMCNTCNMQQIYDHRLFRP